ncbi:MAG: SPOR domain-containing protein [Bacteroidales bacterium]|nr:SPOR domain-containing protein [Bacteroidales bacterium]
MKQLILLFALLAFGFTLTAQNTEIPQTTDVVVLVDNLNTPTNNQFSLTWYKGNLLFSSDRSSPRGSRRPSTPQIYFAQGIYDFQQGIITGWNPIQQLRTVRSSDPTRAFAFDPNTNTYYVMRCPVPRRGRDQVCNIVAHQVDQRGRVSRPANQSFHDDNAIIGNPTLSSDGNVMFFTIQRDGRSNLHMARRTANNTWTTPVMLPAVINTDSTETTPQLFRDSLLFFASNGHPGLGGLDIFVTKIMIDGQGHAVSGSSDLSQLEFSEPINLGAPINSSANDHSMLIQQDGNGGFFISNRTAGGANRQNIYRFNREPQIFDQPGFYLVTRLQGRDIRGVELTTEELIATLQAEMPDVIRIHDTVFVEIPVDTVFVQVPVAQGQEQALLQQKNEEISQLREDLAMTRDELRACFATANQVFHTGAPGTAQAAQPTPATQTAPRAQPAQATRPAQPAAQPRTQPAAPAAQPRTQPAPAARPAPAAQPVADQGRVVYRVQLAAARTPDGFIPDFTALYRAMPNLRMEVITHSPFDGYYRYVTVPFATFEEADAVRRRIQALGFECFVGGYRGNQRVSISMR